MITREYCWRLPSLIFHLVQADIFEIPVEAIVNSEQTDFILSNDGKSISSQIRNRFGPEVQPQLDEQTQWAILDPGTVLKTTGGPYSAIFHAGFHHPTEWLDTSSSEDSETAHLEVIRGCVRRILESVRDATFSSVVFPLIGAGVFGLDPRLIAHNFFEDVFQFALEVKPHKDLDVWLVVYDEPTFHLVLEAGIQAWLTHTALNTQWQPFGVGVPCLDLFEEQVNRERHPRWSAWMHVRYAELVTGYLAFALASGSGENPKNLAKKGKPLTFGEVRRHAERLAKEVVSCQSNDKWQLFFSTLISDGVSQGLIKRLNDDRNAIAHGHESRQPDEIRCDIAQFIQIQKWKELIDHCRPPGQPEMPPWLIGRELHIEAEKTQNIGVFHKWEPGSRTYVIPWCGKEFSVAVESE